jgi:hypothetical protein
MGIMLMLGNFKSILANKVFRLPTRASYLLSTSH